jgi:hypothetical protein
MATNVVMLNFCYDVPVKLYSLNLLLLSPPEDFIGFRSIPTTGSHHKLTRQLHGATGSISGIFQLLSKSALSGPYSRKNVNHGLPGAVGTQLFSCPAGGFGAK